MTNYTKTTDFAAKDSLPSGDSGKIIRGTEFETEFDNIATAVNSKSDANNPTFTGTVTIDGLTVNGNTVLGNAATDTVTVTADIASNLLPSADDTYNLGAVGAEWNDLFIDGVANIDSLVADTADINGGTVDGVTIGGSSAGAITGTTITGTGFVTSGDMTFGDNDKAVFGAGSDLQIYHDGGHSYIDDAGTGLLRLRSNTIYLEKYTGELLADFNADGYVSLLHDNSEKFRTTSTGIDVTGSASVSGDLLLGSNGRLRIGSNGTIASPSIYLDTDTNTGVYFPSVDTIGVVTGGVERLNVGAGGDISFYEDTGTTPKFFWDASAESLGIGTSSPNAPLEVSSSGITAPRITSSDGLGDAVQRYYSGSTYKGQIGWDQSADVLGLFGAGGSGVPNLAIDSSNNVGIGTTSPARPLHIAAPSGNNVPLRVEAGSSTTASYIDLKDASTTADFKVRVGSNGDDFVAYAGGAEHMRIDVSGRLGVGTAAPAYKIDVAGTGRISNGLYFNNASSGGFIYEANAQPLRFGTGNSEAMRIDSSQNVLVGKTASLLNTVGSQLQATGLVRATTDGSTALQLNRKTSDGTIVEFYKDGGTPVGSIGVAAGNNLYIGGSATDHTGLIFPDDAVLPAKELAATDDFVDLGSTTRRFKDLHLSGGAYLGGTAAANKLDDYEEGTWTPALADSAGNTVTQPTGSGFYRKVGSTCTIYGQITNMDTTGLTSSEDLYVTDLPFSSDSVARGISPVQFNQVTNASKAHAQLVASAPGISGTVVLFKINNDSNGSSAGVINVSEFVDGASDMFFCMTYITA